MIGWKRRTKKGGAILDRVIREGFSGKETFEQRPEEMKELPMWHVGEKCLCRDLYPYQWKEGQYGCPNITGGELQEITSKCKRKLSSFKSFEVYSEIWETLPTLPSKYFQNLTSSHYHPFFPGDYYNPLSSLPIFILTF